MRAIGVIPSRWASSRFPGKSLALIGGKPLVQWVLEQARQASSLNEVLVATDDTRIVAAVEQLGGRAVITAADHPSGTDRIAEAIQGLEADIVVNIQGDEPLIDPTLIDQLVLAVAENDAWDMATAAVPIRNPADIENPSIVKVVFAADQRALYFSRSVIPCVREKGLGVSPEEPLYWRHIGIYVYRRPFLEKMVCAAPSALEEAEKLEQLRALHLGACIKVIAADCMGPGVDTPEDMPKAEAALKRAGLI